jgi:hypothetical protein
MNPSSDLPDEIKTRYREDLLVRLRLWRVKRDAFTGWGDFCWKFASAVYEQDGLVLMDFNERRQQCFLRSGFKAWCQETDRALDVAQQPVAKLPLFSGEVEGEQKPVTKSNQ